MLQRTDNRGLPNDVGVTPNVHLDQVVMRCHVILAYKGLYKVELVVHSRIFQLLKAENSYTH